MINVDFTNVQSQFEPIPPGTYEAEIVEASEKVSQNGSQMIELRLQVEHEGRQRKLFFNLVFHENAMWKVKQIMKNLGFDVSGPLEINASDFVGLPCRVVVNNEQYEGETRSRVTNILAPKMDEKLLP